MRIPGSPLALLLYYGIAIFAIGLAGVASLPPAVAQTASVQTAPAQIAADRPTLERALAIAAARHSEAGVALAVAAQQTRLPPGATLPPPDAATVRQVARSFGRLVRPFGQVTALAPPTMVLVGLPPQKPNPWIGMPPENLLKLLAATFTEAQWDAFFSKQGLGVANLSGETQRDLFLALFPGGVLRVQYDRPDGPNRDEDIQDVSRDLSAARLRLGQRVNIGMPVASKSDIHVFGMVFSAQGAPKIYVPADRMEYEVDSVNGARVRSEVPNRPKVGQLDLNAPALQVPVALAKVKTVGNLIDAIARATQLELYADRRFEGKKVTLVGQAGAVSAADLLRALALCVTGSFRRVGPAFVLTDDVIGIGTRRERWALFEREADQMRRTRLDKATALIYSRQPAPQIPAFSEPMALTAKQREMSQRHKAERGGSIAQFAGEESVELPLDQLTPAQQEVARRTFAYYSREPDRTLEGTFIVQSAPLLELLLPSLDGPVQLNFSARELFQVPQEVVMRQQVQQAQAGVAAAATSAPNAPSRPDPDTDPSSASDALEQLRTLLRSAPRRAIYAQPRTAAEVTALVTSMKQLGLNELWLDVFSEGTAHVSGASAVARAANPDADAGEKRQSTTQGATDSATESPTSATGATGAAGVRGATPPDVLQLALEAAKATNKGTDNRTDIRVFAVLDLLVWGKAPPENAADLNILGETSFEAQVRQAQREDALTRTAGYNYPSQVPTQVRIAVVCQSPAVRDALIPLIRSVVRRPGLGGIVFRETAPPGYAVAAHAFVQSDRDPPPLGYTDGMRFAFLRQEHVDPVDIYPSEYRSGRANTKLPHLDDDDIDRTLIDRWRLFRTDANVAFLRALAAVAVSGVPSNASGASNSSSADSLPLLLQARSEGDGRDAWYGSWDLVSAAPPPLLRRVFASGEAYQDEVTQAKAQSKAALVTLPLWPGVNPALYLRFARGLLATKGWDGFVLDTVTLARNQPPSAPASGTAPVNPLATLISVP